MNKPVVLMLMLSSTLLVACGGEKKIEQVIIPQAQLDALDKAKNLENDLLKMQQNRDKEMQLQIN